MFAAVTGKISGAEEISGAAPSSASPAAPQLTAAARNKIHTAVTHLIEKTTGIQTLAQMGLLRELVANFGYVAAPDILAPEAYKKIYNRALLAAMEQRRQGIATGRLTPADLTLKGATEFLARLAQAGTKLYLASGTDEDEVKAEAALLGYADLFTGGIRGSVGDIKNDPKKVVIRQLIAEIKQAGQDYRDGRVVVFGDGPVEMREAKKAGVFAIGIVSDEARRYGANFAKRERLILAGADLLLPDFSWAEALIDFCHWQ
jgi:phosphoglycolate phosphatase-like HAD superfamily hydrolase